MQHPTPTHALDHSPLDVLDAAFLTLARDTTQPLTLPHHLLNDQDTRAELPVDQVRARLAHPSASPTTRARIWSEVVRRAHTHGEPWITVATAMAIPAVRRMLSRLPHPGLVERCELEQEALAAVVEELLQVDPADALLERRLVRAADRARHRIVYHALRNPATPHATDFDELCRHLHTPDIAPGEHAGDEYTVLARAVQAKALNVGQAQVIARTRLHGEPMAQLASEWGISIRQLYRQRAEAEHQLSAHLSGRSAL